MGGTYAHTDIAFEFASWISPEFKLYIIKDYQRLKKNEAERLAIGWDVKRELSKINYRIHTGAVKEFLITPTLSPQEMAYTYDQRQTFSIWHCLERRQLSGEMKEG